MKKETKKKRPQKKVSLAPMDRSIKSPQFIAEEETAKKKARAEDYKRWKEFQKTCPEYNKWLS